MFLWDALACAVWLTDLLRLPAAAQLRARRVWSEPLSLGRPSSVRIELENSGRVPIQVSLIDETPLALREQPP